MNLSGIRYFGKDKQLQVISDHTGEWVPVKWIELETENNKSDPAIVPPGSIAPNKREFT